MNVSAGMPAVHKTEFNSDVNPTMAASAMFESIIDQVRSSNLNFQIQMTPFSANIVIKKTLIRDYSGLPLIPPTCKNYYKEEKENYETNAAEMEAHKDSFAKVQNDLKEAMTKNESYQEIIKNLQEALAIKKEMENREKHEDKKKNCPQNKVEIKGVKQKSNHAKAESEQNTFNNSDDNVDMEFSYNVNTSNIFSHLPVPHEESEEETKPTIVATSLSRPPLANPKHPCTAPPSSCSTRSPARTPPPTKTDSVHSGIFAINGEFQNIREELDKVRKILLEEFQPGGSGDTSST